MSVPIFNSAFLIDPACPLNLGHRLNRGRTTWLLAQSATTGNRRYIDLTNRIHAETNLGAASVGGWRSDARPGGGQSVMISSNTSDKIDWFGAIMSSFITATDGTMAIWLKWISATQSAGASYLLPNVMGDGFNGNMGIHIGTIGGLDRIWAYNFGTGENRVGGTYTQGVWMRAMWVHTGGNLGLYINGVSAGTTASGNTPTSGTFNVGGTGGAGVADMQSDDITTWNRGLSASEAWEDYVESITGYPNVLNRISAFELWNLQQQSTVWHTNMFGSFVNASGNFING